MNKLRQLLEQFEIGTRVRRMPKRDRRALLVLAIFLGVIGYWFLLLQPAMARADASSERLRSARREVRLITQKVREYDAWWEDRRAIADRLGELGARIGVPPPDTSTSAVIEAVMEAADRAGVEIASVRPESTRDAGSTDGSATAFTIDGDTTLEAFGAFVVGIWGLRIEEVQLTQIEGGRYPLRFYVRVSLLPAEEFAAIAAAGEGYDELGELLIGEDAFVARRPPAPPRPSAPAPRPLVTVTPPPPRSLELGGLRLVGISQLGGERLAIVVDSREGSDLFVREGEQVRGYEIAEIREDALTLTDGELSGEIRLPRLPEPEIPIAPPTDFQRLAPGVARDWAANGGASPGTRTHEPAAADHARLGVPVVAITPLMASRQGLSVTSGLLVSGQPGENSELQPGDVIVSINGQSVGSLRAMLHILAELEPGSQLQLAVVRAGDELAITLVAS